MAQYWNPDKIESAIAECGGPIPLRIIAGPNRIGKTYGGVKLVVDALKAGNNALWMRMYDAEFKGEFGENFINIMHEIDPEMNLEECEGGLKLDGVQRVYFRSLNVFGKSRGNGSTTGEVTCAILDEFIPEDGRVPKKGVYLPMMALIRTFSNYSENCICWCFANCITPLSDLFASVQAFPKKGLDVTVYPEKGICIEVCRGYGGKIPENGPWARVVQAGKMPGYTEFEGLYIDDFIVRPRHAVATKTALKISDTEFLGLYNDGRTRVWLIVRKPASGSVVLSTDADINCTFLDPKIKNELRKMFFGGGYRFASYNALSRFLKVVEITLV